VNKKLRLGLLRCDTVLPEFKSKYGSYTKMFHQLIASLGAEYSAVELRYYNVERQEYPLLIDECDAYLITGSRASVYDAADWMLKLEDFILELSAQKKKLVGICFGHQLIVQSLGGKTIKSERGWGVGVHSYKLHQYQPWMKPQLESFNLIVSHQDQVSELPDNAVVLAGNDFCPNASLFINNHILTFQGHPEFTKSYSRDLLLYRKKIIANSTFSEAELSYFLMTHEQEIISWILNFCFEEPLDCQSNSNS